MKVKSKKNISLMPKYRFMGFIGIEILDSNKCYLVEIDHIWEGRSVIENYISGHHILHLLS